MSECISEKKIVYINGGEEERPHEAPEDMGPPDRLGEDVDLEEPPAEDFPMPEEPRPLREEDPEERHVEDFRLEGGAKQVMLEKPSDASSESSSESMTTAELLSVDPLYFRLNLFLKSDEGENVANLLKKVCNQLEILNNNFDKFIGPVRPKE